MRKAFEKQTRFGCPGVKDIEVNLNRRDEIISILSALKYIYSEASLRDRILTLVAADVYRDSRDDCGQETLSYWQVLVLAVVRLGCNIDDDRLQDLAEQHRTLRMMMGIGDWDDRTDFGRRRIRDNVCLLRAEMVERINHLVVSAGQELPERCRYVVGGFVFSVEASIGCFSSRTGDAVQG